MHWLHKEAQKEFFLLPTRSLCERRGLRSKTVSRFSSGDSRVAISSSETTISFAWSSRSADRRGSQCPARTVRLSHLDDTHAMFPGCVGSLNHSSTPRLKWVRERTSSILWLCTSTWARNSTEVPSFTSSFLKRIWKRLLVPGASNDSATIAVPFL